MTQITKRNHVISDDIDMTQYDWKLKMMLSVRDPKHANSWASYSPATNILVGKAAIYELIEIN